MPRFIAEGAVVIFRDGKPGAWSGSQIRTADGTIWRITGGGNNAKLKAWSGPERGLQADWDGQGTSPVDEAIRLLGGSGR